MEKFNVQIDSEEYRELIEDSCKNFARGKVMDLIADLIARNVDPNPNEYRKEYSKYNLVCKDADTVIDCILTVYEIMEPVGFRMILAAARNAEAEYLANQEEDPEAED